MDTLLQDYKGVAEMDATSNRFKLMAYDYDLISGKVNGVSYQPGKADAFYHRYEYDAENRLTSAWTSRDSIVWERDAAYSYYKHGPLARTELGQLRVQGMDYVYTLHGWIKGVNSTTMGDGSFDIGNDGLVSANSVVARDVLGFALHYYDDSYSEMDYKAIGGTSAFARPPFSSAVKALEVKSLYNGNIGGISMNNAALSKGNPITTNALPLFYNYGYDQLHRIVSMVAGKGLNTTTNEWDPVSLDALDDYEEAVSYDPNGNILTYVRAGAPEKSLPAAMDRLTYNYYTGTNKLHYVDDLVSSGNYAEDIDDQGSGNYTYDAIGNLITDAAEGITRIGWTVYGKIDTIVKSGDDIYYTYDATGNRITKKVGNTITVYVRDAQGNVMSVYEKVSLHALAQVETHLYGSSRIGILGKLTTVPSTISLAGGYGSARLSTFTRGERFFELSNHLGNVLSTITDKKLQHHDGSGGIDYYTADVATANDYYPFGMGMPGRKYAANDAYRYGFNGKENDNDVKGEGNQQDYGMRIYDPRLGKFLSQDPLFKKYPELTPYQFASNGPIAMIDIDGLEGFMNISGDNMPGPTFHVSFDVDGDHIPDYNEGWATGMMITLTGGFSVLTGGMAYGAVGSTSASAILTNITSKAVINYTMYSTAAANAGAFIIELANPDPNGTPGLEFTQGDEIARGIKLLFKQTAAPIVKPIEKFILNTNKFDYLFGKLEYQSLKGAELEAFANSAKNIAGKSTKELIKNQDRAADLARTMEYWGIEDNEAGLAKLGELFNKGLNGMVVEGGTKVDQYGTSILREISLTFIKGSKKGQAAGKMQISYFYKNSNMNSTPEITSIIAIPVGRE